MRITIENNIWQDHFIDGTYSSLKFKWISECEFEIEFVKSNNELRKNFSKAGDKYRYQILAQGAGFYEMFVEVVGSTGHLASFKLYY